MTRIAVLGAGIVGAAVAYALTRAGADVTLVEADAPASGTTGTSLAWVNANNKPPRTYHEFSVRALTEWQRLAREFGNPGWYVPTGSLTWAETDQQRASLAGRLARLREWGYPVEELTAGALARLEPRLRVPRDAQAAFFPVEGFVHAGPAVEALVSGARAGGARLVLAGGPATLEARGRRVTAIRLPDGDRLRADAYVCCAGWRTPGLVEPLGVRVLLIPPDAPGSAAPCVVARIPLPQRFVGRVVNAPGLSLRPARDGGLHMDAEDVNARIDARTPPSDLDRHAAELVARACRIVPTLAADAPVDARLCVRPMPVDGKPIIGWPRDLDNTYLIVGHSGVTLAPLLARLAVAEVAHGQTLDLDDYRLARFG
jgi:glycine/D-amino acid oxidase-like deaminating enzyme